MAGIKPIICEEKNFQLINHILIYCIRKRTIDYFFIYSLPAAPNISGACGASLESSADSSSDILFRNGAVG